MIEDEEQVLSREKQAESRKKTSQASWNNNFWGAEKHSFLSLPFHETRLTLVQVVRFPQTSWAQVKTEGLISTVLPHGAAMFC